MVLGTHLIFFLIHTPQHPCPNLFPHNDKFSTTIKPLPFSLSQKFQSSLSLLSLSLSLSLSLFTKPLTNMATPQSNLPPGFRFHPTDAELILHYLRKKIASIPLPVSIIAEVDIYKLDPWQLPAKALFGEKEWYFFSPRDRKYPNGARPNRAAASGYWKATGTDKTIVASLPCGGRSQENIIGVKKALVFYKGKPPKGIKTNWIMHEYRLVDNNKPIKLKDSSMRLDDWVLCRIYKKSKCALTSTESETMIGEVEQADEARFKETLSPMTKIITSPYQNTLISQKSVSFSNLLDAMDYSMLSNFLSENHSNNPSGIGTSSNFNNTENFNQQHQSSQNNTSNNYMSQNKNLKHHLSNIDEDNNMLLYPSKKYLTSSCNFSNINTQYESYLMKQSLMNQQLVLGPHHQYQG